MELKQWRSPHHVNQSFDEGPPLYQNCLTCDECNKVEPLPCLYWEDKRSAGFAFLCGDCLGQASGHAECEEPRCSTCMLLGEEISRRAIVAHSFLNGTLEVEEEEVEEVDPLH